MTSEEKEEISYVGCVATAFAMLRRWWCRFLDDCAARSLFYCQEGGTQTKTLSVQ